VGWDVASDVQAAVCGDGDSELECFEDPALFVWCGVPETGPGVFP